MRIIVEAKSPFGILNAEDKKWYNPANKDSLKDIKVGQAYDIVLGDVKGTDGKVRKQITNMVIVDLNKGAVAVAEKPAVEVKTDNAQVQTEVKKTYSGKQFTPRKTFVPKADNGLSKEEWAQKDVRISRQGLIQAAVQALAHLHTPPKLFDEAAKLADQMLEYVRREAK